ncbi:MAG: hypothetical protein J6P93_00045 [Alphaproteobacteria bacterium]|nr:hypothetical protein [Alphaproteobacteria bacterium]
MKRFIFYFLFGLMAFLATSGMFILKYHVVGKEKALARTRNQITENNRSIHILRAEWTNLSDSKRLRILVEKNTKLQKIKPSQVIHWEDVAFQDDKGGV